jgi:steroid delta-isomerase
LTVDLGEGAKMRIDIISVMTFDDEAKITSMKAYWGQENVTQL